MVEVTGSNLPLFEIQEKIMESYHYDLMVSRYSIVSFLIGLFLVVRSLSLSFLIVLLPKNCSCHFFFHLVVVFSFFQSLFFISFSSKRGKNELVSIKVEERI